MNCWLGLVDFMDLRLLLDPVYVNIAVGMAFTFFSDITVAMLITLVIMDLGYSHAETALFISTFAAGDIAGRLAITMVGAVLPELPSRVLFFFGAASSIISRMSECLFLVEGCFACTAVAWSN